MKPKIVRCPQCGTQAEYKTDNPSRPFCSDRCKLIDLGAWAEERYAIAGAPVLTDSTGPLPAGEVESALDIRALPDQLDRRLDS